jgi:phage-related protein
MSGIGRRWLQGELQMRTKITLTLILISLLCLPVRAQLSDKEITQACRQALLDLKRAQLVEATLREQVAELRAADSVSQERIKHLNEAATKYEAAVKAREEAEKLVADLRVNHAQQIAVVEKQLAIEQGKSRFWRSIARIGTATGILIGAAVTYVLTKD